MTLQTELCISSRALVRILKLGRLNFSKRKQLLIIGFDCKITSRILLNSVGRPNHDLLEGKLNNQDTRFCAIDFRKVFVVSGKEAAQTHCSHLDIHISQKTRLCVVNLEGQFQTSLEAKQINFFI